jgi:ATP-binding cassette, subfamily B, bacterial
MGWGGGHFGGGGWGGGHGAVRAAGLPFAGIPPELKAAVDKLQENEPEIPLRPVEFSQRLDDADQRFTLGRFLRPHRGSIVAALVLVAIDTATLHVGPLLTQLGIDKGIIAGNFGLLLTVSLLYLGSIAINSVTGYFRISFTGKMGQRLMHDLRIKTFSQIQRLSLDFFTKEKAGRIMTRMTSDIEALQQLFSDGIVNLAVQAITLVFVIGVLLSMNISLALVILIAVVPVMTGLTLWFRSASDTAFLRVRDRIADVLADLSETLSGIRVLTMHNRQRHNSIRHRNIAGDHMEANLSAVRISGTYGAAAEAVGDIGKAVILLVGAGMVARGSLTVGQLTAFVLYLTSVFAPITQLVALHSTYQQGKAAVTKLADLFAMQPSVPEREGARELPPIRGEIKLENLTFGYNPETVVLHDVDLTIAPGETFALVGPTGAGKSTVAKLVTRFYDPLAGRILVDGHDLREVKLDSLRRQLGVVPQEPFLFAGSIRDNIAFARPDATDEEVDAACAAVGITEVVARLPKGLDTPCHERGVTLSSGERQLLALARAFLAQPRVLILDEATSALDLATESMVERALDVVLEGRTAILIAHRLNTAMRADRIGVVEAGRLVEVGSHEELVALGGRYAAMHELWVAHGGATKAAVPTGA